MSPEPAFFQAFVHPSRRQRYVALLGAKGGREKVLSALHHFKDLDARFCRRIDSARQTPVLILRMLNALGAPPRCHVMSSDRKPDGREWALSGVLQEIVGSGQGAIISCIPAKLAYFESEELGERYLCCRD